MGERLVAFFALLYFAALRPGEALALRLGDCVMPESGWGELHLARSNSQPGFAWTDDGEPAPSRSLKHRAHGEVRHVPACPELVSYLRNHIETFGTGTGGQLFVSPFAQTVPKSAYARVWREARRQVLSKEQAASPLAKRPYDLRHAAVSMWLAAGVPVTLVAEWAGHTVEILLRVYAWCLLDAEDAARKRIEQALGEPEPREDPPMTEPEPGEDQPTPEAPDASD